MPMVFWVVNKHRLEEALMSNTRLDVELFYNIANIVVVCKVVFNIFIMHFLDIVSSLRALLINCIKMDLEINADVFLIGVIIFLLEKAKGNVLADMLTDEARQFCDDRREG
eukprot:4694484-Ditylum_brightwellii.AAC.1